MGGSPGEGGHGPRQSASRMRTRGVSNASGYGSFNNPPSIPSQEPSPPWIRPLRNRPRPHRRAAYRARGAMPTMPADIHDMRKALPALLADANKTLQKEHVMLVAQGHLREAAAANDSASDGTEASALLDDSEADPSPGAANPHSPAAPRQEEQSNAAGLVVKRESPPREAALQCQEIDGPSRRADGESPTIRAAPLLVF